MADNLSMFPARRIRQTLLSSSTQIVDQPTNAHQRSNHPKANYHIRASALYEPDCMAPGRGKYGESSAPSSADPVAIMELYMKKTAQEEKRKEGKQSKGEMPPHASLQVQGTKGHHMGDYIPRLKSLRSSCLLAQKAAKEADERAKIQADNVGHKTFIQNGMERSYRL